MTLNEAVDRKEIPSFFDHLLTERIEISEAPEPTDIIWENRYYSDKERGSKAAGVAVVIVILLLISAGFIFTFSVKGKKLKEKYPLTDCIDITKFYDDLDEEG